MLNPITILSAMLIALLTVTPAAAQQTIPGGKWWKMPAVAKRLNLSDQEVRQLDDAYRDSRRQMIRFKAEVETEQLELQSIIEDRELDEAAALAQYRKLDKARSELGLARFHFFLKVREIVGHERFNTLLRWREMRRQRFPRQGDSEPASDG
jgi:Spy/CpxP family protein refolding chaperone